MVLNVSRSALVKPAASRPFTPWSSVICGDSGPCCAFIRSSTFPMARIRRALVRSVETAFGSAVRTSTRF